MSQREGRPRSECSSSLLKLVSSLCCFGEAQNEWGTVWSPRSLLHHATPPPRHALYAGHTFSDKSPKKSVDVGTASLPMQVELQIKSAASNGFDSV